MNDFFQLVFQSLGIGAIYALVSLGFVLLIRAASVVNFGQGEFSMLGVYLLVVFFNILGLNYFFGIGLFDSDGFQIGEVFISSQYLAIIVIAAALVLLQYVIFEKTLLGKKLQATSQDKEMASLLGIPVVVMIMITFAYSAALGGLAGILVAPIRFVSVGMAGIITLKAFAANIIGVLGLVVVLGYCGQISIAQAAYLGGASAKSA